MGRRGGGGMRGSETHVPTTILPLPSRALSCEATWGSSEEGHRGRTMWESSDPGSGGGACPRSPPPPAKDARRGGLPPASTVTTGPSASQRGRGSCRGRRGPEESSFRDSPGQALPWLRARGPPAPAPPNHPRTAGSRYCSRPGTSDFPSFIPSFAELG